MKIAVVGSGVSGLVVAHNMHRHHDVTVFEAEARIGGHVRTVDVVHEGVQHAIDTGFSVYNERTHPNFSGLLREIGAETQPSEMSFGLSCERTGVEWASRGLGAVFAQPRNLVRPAFLRMVRDILRFNRDSPALLEGESEKVALGDYLVGAGYSQRFIDHYAVPIGAAIWASEPEALLRFPAATFVRFFDNHGLLETRPSLRWRVSRGGAMRYIEKLVAPFRDKIRLNAPVKAIRRRPRHVEVAHGDEVERFDRVVLALHSNQALRLLVDPSGLERLILSRIGYQENEVVLHTDESLMPQSRRADASWNTRIPKSPQDRVFVTYDVNRLQGLSSSSRFLVTLNGGDRIDPQQEIARFTYEHPVLDAHALEAQQRRHEISGAQRTHYCGAYWGYGFHEDGVRSALDVCAELEDVRGRAGSKSNVPKMRALGHDRASRLREAQRARLEEDS